MTDDHETSSTYLFAISTALRHLERYEQVLARLSPEARHALEDPQALDWWPSTPIIALVEAIHATGGDELIRRVGQEQTISTLIRPLLSLVLSLSGRSPVSIFSRFPQFAVSATRNVHFKWSTLAEQTGRMVVMYPRAVPSVVAGFWAGGFDFVFQVTNRTGESKLVDFDTQRLTFDLTWAAEGQRPPNRGAPDPGR